MTGLTPGLQENIIGTFCRDQSLGKALKEVRFHVCRRHATAESHRVSQKRSLASVHSSGPAQSAPDLCSNSRSASALEITLSSRNHDLSALSKSSTKCQSVSWWKAFLTLAASFGCDTGDSAFVAVGVCVEDMARLDVRSTTFRYATDLRGQIQQLPTSINLKRLHDA